MLAPQLPPQKCNPPPACFEPGLKKWPNVATGWAGSGRPRGTGAGSGPAGFGSEGAQERAQQVVLGVAVPQVLAEALGEGHAAGAAAAGAPVAHRLQVLVHAVVLEQPLALAGVG